VAINKKYAGSFDRAKDERELMDEIYLLAGSEAYRGQRMHAIVGRSRPEVIAWYFAENPEIKRWVDHSIEAGTCADASAGLRAKKEEFRRWLHEQREDLPRPERNPEFAWMDAFRMKPIEISALSAPAKNAVGPNKPRPMNPAVRQWMRDRVASWPDDKSTPSEGDDWDAVQQHFAPGLSREEFRNVRSAETPPEWRKQGPRKPLGQVKN
jgi:hypothetical protein